MSSLYPSHPGKVIFLFMFCSIALPGQGLKSWGYDTENPLKELPIADRNFMAITKLQLMGLSQKDGEFLMNFCFVV